VQSCIYITDPDWLSALEKSGVRTSVNFWRKDRRKLSLLPGSPFYFKLKGSMEIGGRSYFRKQLQLTTNEAWTRFGIGNGVASLAELITRTDAVLQLTSDSINCLVLDGLEILPDSARPMLSLDQFPPGIMNCKFFEAGELKELERAFSK
jgi:hypothetical protein